MGSPGIRRSAGTTLVLGCSALLLLAGCAGAPGPNLAADLNAGHTAGFWAGLWHGLIMPITFIVSLFTDEVNIYDGSNNGGWYNFGFLLGAMIILGGGGHGRRVRKPCRSQRN